MDIIIAEVDADTDARAPQLIFICACYIKPLHLFSVASPRTLANFLCSRRLQGIQLGTGR